VIAQRQINLEYKKMPHASSDAVAAKFHVGQRFTGAQFLVTMRECRQVSQYIVNRRDAERRPLFVRFIWCFPGRGDPAMEQRDWELLDKQVRGHRPPRNDGVAVLTVVAVLFAGMILGGLLVPHESELMRIASNDARTAISLPNGAPPTTWR
jgi:hypothetical protein